LQNRHGLGRKKGKEKKKRTREKMRGVNFRKNGGAYWKKKREEEEEETKFSEGVNFQKRRMAAAN
jgi:hypothetical protein